MHAGKSTINQLTSITHNIYKAIDKGKDIRVVFLDMSKAFDKVWHKCIVHKLKCKGVSGSLLRWFESYLEGRRQRVVIDGSFSDYQLTHPPLTLNGFELEQVSAHRHLGLVFNSSFTWNDHIEHLCQKTGKLINMMKYLKYILPREALEKIYISRTRSMIEYGNVLYDNCPKYLSNRLKSVQLNAARVCAGALPQSNCQNTLTEIGWETLQTRRKWHKLIHMYKIVNQPVPDYLHSHCPDLVSRTNAYNTRQSNSLRFPICRTSAFKNSFFPSTTRYWNGIDIHTRNSESLSIFKN